MLRWLLLLLVLHLTTAAIIRRDLVANRAGLAAQNTSEVQAAVFDSNLVNPWGIAIAPTLPVTIANAGSGTLTTISGSGVVESVISVGTDSPTGLVWNPYSADFRIPSTSANGTASTFLTATEQGNIWAWGETQTNRTSAVRVASSNSSFFQGLAIGSNGTQHFLFATDFGNRKVVVFDAHFNRVNLSSTAFVDPNLPSGFSPYGVANILGDIFVSYAKQNESDIESEERGAGLGVVSVFDGNGNFIRRFASAGDLNAPWGMTLAPVNFGQFGGSLLIGNFGDGRISAFDLRSGDSLGQLSTSSGATIAIEGLWGIEFGNGILNQPTNTLFFAAGINDENDGLFGRIDSSGASNSTSK